VGQEKGALVITNSNQVYFAKVLGREVQEEVLFFPNPADQKSHVKAFTYKSLEMLLKKVGNYE
jgi:hypothetical protein